MSDVEALRDRIYEAAVIPELWPEACDLIAAEVGAYSTAIITISPLGHMASVSSNHIADSMQRYFASDLSKQNIRVPRSLEQFPATFSRDVDCMTREEIANDPIYEEFLRPIGLGWTAGAVFQEPSGSMLIFDLLRVAERGEFTPDDMIRINSIKADMARAAFMSTRLAFDRAVTTTQTLSALGLPGAVLGETGHVRAMNREMEALSPRLGTGAFDRIFIRNANANKLFHDIVRQIGMGLSPEVKSVPVPATEEEPALVIQLVPVKRNARDVFSQASVIVIATPIGQVGPPDLRVISGLFDLTRTEVRVAQQMIAGQSGAEAASALGITSNTFRTHAKSVFRKTGVNRQTELAALLSGLWSREQSNPPALDR